MTDPRTHILVVEDEVEMQVLLHAHLTRLGYSVATAGTLAQARTRLKNRCPDVVLLDLNLGKEWGLDLLPDLRTCNAAMVCIVITARNDAETRAQALQAGVDHFLAKPVSPSVLNPILPPPVNPI